MSCGVGCRQGSDPTLPWLCVGWQLQPQFNPWPGNFHHVLQVQPERKKKKNQSEMADKQVDSFSIKS